MAKVYTTIHIYQEDGNAWQISDDSRKSFTDAKKAVAYLREHIARTIDEGVLAVLAEFDNEVKKQENELADTGFSYERADNEEDWSGFQDYFAVWATEVEE